MSQWKFNNFEAEVDFTDVDFLEKIENAQELLRDDIEAVPKTGKSSEIVRAQNQCYDNFFDRIFYDGASKEIFVSNSMSERVAAVTSLKELEDRQEEMLGTIDKKYQVQKGNRAQRRYASRKNHNNRKWSQ